MLKSITQKINQRLQEVDWTKRCEICQEMFFPSRNNSTKCPQCQSNSYRSAKLKGRIR